MAKSKGTNLFDILDRQPAELPQQLRLAGQKERIEFIEGLLRTEPTDNSLLTQIESTALDISDAAGDEFLGAAFFLLFSHFSERFNETGEDSYQLEATLRLNKSSTKKFLTKKYHIPESYLQDSLMLYKVGTTSIIIKIEEKYILKILKYRYRDNPRIRSATKGYKDKFGDLINFAPNVHLSSDFFMIMDFIPGKTLREDIENAGQLNLKKIDDASNHISRIEKIITQLLEILHNLHEGDVSIVHMDLNPDNVILRPTVDQKDFNVVLIDFGYNYILQEKIGTTSQILTAQTSVAPELRDSPAKATGRADLYSFGMLFLFMITGKAGQLPDVDSQLDRIWQEYPEFGGLIESMIEAEPNNRLPERLYTETDYEFLSRRLTSAFDLFRASKLEAPHGWRKALANLPISGQYQKVFSLARQYKAVQDKPALALEIRRLLRYSIIAQFAHTVILAAAFFYLSDDFGLSDINQRFLFKRVREFLGIIDLSPGTWRENIWGRIVGITFSIVAVRYYQNIHSSVSARGISRWTEFWLRFNSFCFAFPILWLMLIKPSHWPFCAFIGVLFVAINNYSTLATAKSSLQRVMNSLKLPISLSRLEEFLKLYDSYSLNSAIYSGTLLIAGLALVTGFAQDDELYALMVSFVINLGVMYITACTTKAPTIRGNLMRLYEGCLRSKLIQLKK